MAKMTRGRAGLLQGIVAAGTLLVAGTASAQTFDAGKPADVAPVLVAAGATGEIKTDDITPYFAGKAEGVNFSLNFAECDKAGAHCKVAYYMAFWTVDKPPTLEQYNAWNDVTYACPALKGARDGMPFLKFGYIVSASDTAETVKAQLKFWNDCAAEFQDFMDDPSEVMAIATPAS